MRVLEIYQNPSKERVFDSNALLFLIEYKNKIYNCSQSMLKKKKTVIARN